MLLSLRLPSPCFRNLVDSSCGLIEFQGFLYLIFLIEKNAGFSQLGHPAFTCTQSTRSQEGSLRVHLISTPKVCFYFLKSSPALCSSWEDSKEQNSCRTHVFLWQLREMNFLASVRAQLAGEVAKLSKGFCDSKRVRVRVPRILVNVIFKCVGLPVIPAAGIRR